MKYSKLQRIYYPSNINVAGVVLFEDDNFHYLKSVMRARIGYRFRVFNATGGEFVAEIIFVNKNSIHAKIIEKFREPVLLPRLNLAMCIIKQDRMIEALKGVCQLGVTKIIPVISSRCQHKTLNREKLHKILIQASEQCERFCIPELEQPTTLEEFLSQNNSPDNASNSPHIVFANEHEESRTIEHINVQGSSSIIPLIGPEGGFDDEEIQKLSLMQNASSISLGQLVLRSEIAVISLLSKLRG